MASLIVPRFRRTVVDGDDGRVILNPRQRKLEVSKTAVGMQGLPGPPGATLAKHEQLMQAGVVTYPLPEIPSGATIAFVNGVEVTHTISGVNITITEYTAGSIESDDVLTVFY